MDVLKAIEARRSIRKYKSASIPGGDLRKIVEAARLAPSAGNRQPWRFIVARDSELKRRIAEAAREQMFIADAGAVVVAMADAEASPRWFEKDTMIAVEHMVLAATSLGYGTCWIGAFTEEEVKRILGIPEGLRVVALLPVGVPDESPGPKPRRPLDEIFHGEKYGKKLEL
ncbi:hypothetical protein AC482_06550 [miscellaneous Crenarchaeota group-15 archaeon DG-45]|uniref:Nitroreductase domain-containing protein n=1 Tax=miscellaneous Crenarchaeota group-15 archaeon DG-45 TaxID=1685127 RepID=A0A0M0BLF9_9ARCH|nr:MAG: hypothetical protein AC482_06550 [miscellaneous Crenarchaeota group-15 archaeon DG-45]